MSSWKSYSLKSIAEIRISNVDKKSKAGEKDVLLCNYMDVYANDYIKPEIEFMQATASLAEIEKFKVLKGDVLITKDSETPYDIGIPAAVTDVIENLVCGYHLALIKPNAKLIDSTYLAKQLASSITASYFSKLAAGSTRYGLSNGAIARTPVSVPDLETQRKISSVLSKMDQTIEKTEALIEKYQQIKAGLMHDLFTRGVTADGKLRPTREQAPELYQETPIGWMPKDWDIKTVSELANQGKGSTVIGPFGSDLVMSDYRTEGTPVVFVRDVKEDKFHWVSNVFVSSEKAQALFAHRVKPGDILATKMGLPPCVAAVYPEDMPMGIITADMIRMAPDISKVDPNWLSAALNYDRTKRQVAAITAGVTRPKVTLSDFRSLRLAVPKPEEQKTLVKILTANLQVLHSEEAKLGKLKKQKKGLMLDLLTGKVEVKVEEPEEAHV